jgi:hypothetical protein
VRNFIKALRTRGYIPTLRVGVVAAPELLRQIDFTGELDDVDRDNVEKMLGLFREAILLRDHGELKEKAHARGSGGSTCCGEWAPALLSGLADQHVVRNRSGAGADAEESIERRMPCAAPVEAEYELVQVVLKICPSQAVVNAQAPALEI